MSVHPQVIDGDKNTAGTTLYTIYSRLPAGLNTNRLTIAISPTCTHVGSGKCDTPTTRTAGANIAVTSTYDISDILILPSIVGWGSWRIAIPQSLPSYTITMQVEPT